MLSKEQITEYAKNGYLVLPNFKTSDELAAIKRRANEIASAHDIDAYKTIFSTDQCQQEIEQDYFLNSANTVRCFLEEKAIDAHGVLTHSLECSINKIGHAMHDLDPVFERFSHGKDLAMLAADLGLQNPQIWQSMYIFKQPHIGGKVDWHQDASFFQTDPISVTTFWFAIDDAVLENGCLWVEEGGHGSPLREVFTRGNNQTKMTTINSAPWPQMKSAKPVEVKAGALVCFHGKLPHYSAQNRSAKARHAYTLHVTDGNAQYSPYNWIQRDKNFPVRGFV